MSRAPLLEFARWLAPRAGVTAERAEDVVIALVESPPDDRARGIAWPLIYSDRTAASRARKDARTKGARLSPRTVLAAAAALVVYLEVAPRVPDTRADLLGWLRGHVGEAADRLDEAAVNADRAARTRRKRDVGDAQPRMATLLLLHPRIHDLDDVAVVSRFRNAYCRALRAAIARGDQEFVLSQVEVAPAWLHVFGEHALRDELADFATAAYAQPGVRGPRASLMKAFLPVEVYGLNASREMRAGVLGRRLPRGKLPSGRRLTEDGSGERQARVELVWSEIRDRVDRHLKEAREQARHLDRRELRLLRVCEVNRARHALLRLGPGTHHDVVHRILDDGVAQARAAQHESLQISVVRCAADAYLRCCADVDRARELLAEILPVAQRSRNARRVTQICLELAMLGGPHAESWSLFARAALESLDPELSWYDPDLRDRLVSGTG